MYVSKFLLVLPLLLVTVVNAQESPSVLVGQGRDELQLKFNLVTAIPRTEIPKLQNISNYRLYELVKPEDFAAVVAGNVAVEIERINLLTDAKKKKEQLDQLAIRLRSPSPYSFPNLISAGAPVCDLDCARISLQLTTALDYDKTYVLTIAGVMLENKPVKPVEFKIEKNASIVEALDASNTREEVRIRSTGPLAVSSSTLTIEERTLRINAAGTHVQEQKDTLTAVATQTNSNLINATLNKKLNARQSHALSTAGSVLTDGTKVPIIAKGTISIPGAPSPPDDPKFTLELATNAAVHAKPQFDLDFAYAPYMRYPFWKPGWYLQPEIKADVGLGDTKSDNTISFALLAHYSSDPSNLGTPGLSLKDVQLKTFYKWRKTPWYRLGYYDFFIGPKLEADRAFHRVNMLGDVRFEFRFHRWVATIAEKRKLLTPELKQEADLVEINRGFRVIPYLTFDFGGSVRNETVENKDKNLSLSVPRHSIFRTNVGFKSLFQWRLFSFPMTLKFEERLMHLAKHEDVAFETDEGIGFRSLRGFHHRGEAQWGVAFDPAQHFNFTVTYENGRKAPDFEYLNKISTGFKIIF